MPIPTAFFAGAGTGAVGLYAVQKNLKSNSSSGHTQHKPQHAESASVDMSSTDSVMFGNSSTSTHGSDCKCCKDK